MSLKVTDLLKDIELPFILKDEVVMAPGIWKGLLYSKDEIEKAYKNTDWKSPDVVSYFLNHEDSQAEKWLGHISNNRFVDSTGEILADVLIYDLNEAIKMKLGAPKFGISPKVVGRAVNGIMKDFVFKNFSHVVDPAIKLAMINNSEIDEEITMSIEQLKDWSTAFVNELPDSSFAVIEKDYTDGNIQDKNARHLPFKDAAGNVDLPHLRNALARVSQIKPIGQMDTKEELIKRALEVLEPVAEKYLKVHNETKQQSKDEVKTMSEEVKVENADVMPAPEVKPVEPQKPISDVSELNKKIDDLTSMVQGLIELVKPLCESEMACKPKPEEKMTQENSEVKNEVTEVKNSAEETKIEVLEKTVEQELSEKKSKVQEVKMSSYTGKGINVSDQAMCNFLKGRM